MISLEGYVTFLSICFRFVYVLSIYKFFTGREVCMGKTVPEILSSQEIMKLWSQWIMKPRSSQDQEHNISYTDQPSPVNNLFIYLFFLRKVVGNCYSGEKIRPVKS